MDFWIPWLAFGVAVAVLSFMGAREKKNHEQRLMWEREPSRHLLKELKRKPK